MQHCEECGAELPNNALFCGRCGKKTANKDESTTTESNAPIEDVPTSQSALSLALNDSQDPIPENRDEEIQETPDLLSEDSAEEEEQIEYFTSEENDEEQKPYLESEKQQEQHSSYPTSVQENEDQTHEEYFVAPGSMQDDDDLDQEILTNQFPEEQPQSTQTPIAPQETQSPYASAQKQGSRPVSRCLLFFLAGLIVIVGMVVALMGLFHLNLPAFGGSSKAVSSSSDNEIINPTGSSLTASICVKTSTPSTSVTNQGSTFILFSSSGCSTVTASKANSTCLIFPNTTGASRKYIFDVSNVAIDNSAYHLILGVVDYTGSTTYNDARHISIGLSEGSTGRNFSWLYRSGSVTIHNDEKSGTMDVILEAVNGGNTLHIVGDWACGRLMKST